MAKNTSISLGDHTAQQAKLFERAFDYLKIRKNNEMLYERR